MLRSGWSGMVVKTLWLGTRALSRPGLCVYEEDLANISALGSYITIPLPLLSCLPSLC